MSKFGWLEGSAAAKKIIIHEIDVEACMAIAARNNNTIYMRGLMKMVQVKLPHSFDYAIHEASRIGNLRAFMLLMKWRKGISMTDPWHHISFSCAAQGGTRIHRKIMVYLHKNLGAGGEYAIKDAVKSGKIKTLWLLEKLGLMNPNYLFVVAVELGKTKIIERFFRPEKGFTEGLKEELRSPRISAVSRRRFEKWMRKKGYT